MNTTMDLAEMIEEAFERATGGARPLQTGYDYRTARRSLNLLTMEWANRGINLWTVEQGTLPLMAGVDKYALPANTIDLVEHSLRTMSGTQSDTALQRISVSSYAAIPNKTQRGRPLQIFIQRTATPVLTLWPVPDKDDAYTLVAWRMRRINDAGPAGNDTMDIPFRFVPAIIAGLAFHLSTKLKEGEPRAVMLKQEYEAAFDLAAQEDRERATLCIAPRIARV